MPQLTFHTFCTDVILQILQDVDTPRSLAASLLIRAGEYEQLVRIARVDPRAFDNAEVFFKDYFVSNLLRKCVDLPTGVDRKQEGIKVWHESEMTCRDTNHRMLRFLKDTEYYYSLSDLLIGEFLSNVSWFVREWMGAVPKDLNSRFGPGATLTDRGRLTSIPDKMSSAPTVTGASLDLVPLWDQTAWARYLKQSFPYRSNPVRADYDRYCGVPKDALKERGICVGPSLNIYFQLGVGSLLRSRLKKRANIDLDGGQSLHTRVACGASLSGEFATIDLSSASDTVAFMLVKRLVSKQWFEVLTTLRTPATRFGSKEHRLHKFSAMGNGYTFELETLIFAAFAAQVMVDSGLSPVFGENVFVYGDDIIVPTRCAQALIDRLSFVGFSTNVRKTYTDGWFRESCGGDFFRGTAVIPHYIEKFPLAPQEWISLANGLRRSAIVSDDGVWLRPWLKRGWLLCLNQIPSSIRKFRGPTELGDVLIHDTPDRWTYRTKHSIRYFWGYTARSIPLEWKYFSPGIQLASALYGVPSAGPTVRSGRVRYRVVNDLQFS